MTDNDKPSGAERAADEPDSGKTSDNSSTVPAYVPEPLPEDEPKRGSISYQDETTAAKKPSVAEQRARRDAQRRQREAEQAAYEEAERKRKKRKRILIGSGVTVGVVALVAVIYAASTPDEVTAQCTTSDGTIVDDDYCDSTYASGHGGYSSGGFIYIGGTSYRYNYGGSGSVGQKVSGGSYVSPSSDTTVKTNSGKTVQRGGLGVSSGGKSGGS
ncbi:hypothetical protein [Actinokineospora globicatena]|uniref:Uncharacterized protein n=1 Tax=Actinokineospora globicatena TaxID=103729 RepID=A0A9W6V9H8_9PSEU|nr:hypothetical protein [Actinokineospora globicatena]GLW91984.1 hypothetical protein Aglo03_28000 [Actinokineospora globicatena]